MNIAKRRSSRSRYRPIPALAKYRTLISPARDNERPVYNWHAFKHSYSKDLVKELIDEFDLKNGAWVLDPFCGGGTTLLACKEWGINSQGYDILPFSVFLTNVKTRVYRPESLRKRLIELRTEKGRAIDDLPDIKLVDKAFSPSVKKELLRLKNKIASIPNMEERSFFMLTLLSILESVSRTARGGGFLRIVEKNVPAKSVKKRFFAKAEAMINDVKIFNADQKSPGVDTSVALGDSRNFPARKKFDAIITSPPYPNRHDYTRIYGLEMMFGFVESNEHMKRIRYDTLRSHVEAKKRFEAKGYQEPKIVEALVKRVKKAGVNNSKVPEMLRGYFEDMYLSLCKMRASLKKDGQIALVVSNVRFGGVNIPVDQILAAIGEQAKLKTTKIITARYRGNSAQQMKTFKREPTRESIIVWSNN